MRWEGDRRIATMRDGRELVERVRFDDASRRHVFSLESGTRAPLRRHEAGWDVTATTSGSLVRWWTDAEPVDPEIDLEPFLAPAFEHTAPPEHAHEADELRNAFLDAVREWGDPGFGDRISSRGDGAFVHVAWLADEAAQKRLGEQEFFEVFSEGMQRVSNGTVTATRLDLM